METEIREKTIYKGALEEMRCGKLWAVIQLPKPLGERRL
jgi:hypothetical protein